MRERRGDRPGGKKFKHCCVGSVCRIRDFGVVEPEPWGHRFRF